MTGHDRSHDPSRPEDYAGRRVSTVMALHVAFSWLTVAPLPSPRVQFDRRIGGAAVAAIPVVGVVMGVGAAALAAALSHTNLPTMLIGVVVVIGLWLVTRGMHVDGLADTADGLGCYGSPARVTEVMRSGSVGPFGVAAVVAVFSVEAIGFGALATDHRWYEIALVVAIGRVAAVIAARRSLPPAHRQGFGAITAGTQRASVVVWTILTIAAAAATGFASPGSTVPDFWSPTSGYDAAHGIIAVLTVVAVVTYTWIFTRHCARRMGGISGDVLGAAVETGTAIAILGFLL